MTESNLSYLLAAHVAASVFMTGLIWFVQVVHYPMFADVDPSVFASYEEKHSRLTTFVVGPPMLIELATAVLLLGRFSENQLNQLAIVGIVMLALIWLSTAFLQVPMHNRLLSGFDEASHRFLVNSNWIRTVLWSARAILSLYLMQQYLVTTGLVKSSG